MTYIKGDPGRKLIMATWIEMEFRRKNCLKPHDRFSIDSCSSFFEKKKKKSAEILDLRGFFSSSRIPFAPVVLRLFIIMLKEMIMINK